ncbi:MAG: SUMF1/EgtB/PvdO family nonheme iron enzyme [Verrucomicrobiota bacterium]
MKVLMLTLAAAGSLWLPSLRVAAAGTPAGMVLIPAGSFEMGDHHGFVDPKHGSDELPLHKVYLDAYYMGIYDVTTREYCEFLNAALAKKLVEVRNGGVFLAGGSDLLCDTRVSAPSSRIGWDGRQFSVLDKKESHPMVCVRWAGAAVYCNWLSAQKGLPACYNTSTWDCDFNRSGFRLPTEPEWEYAGRGGQQNPYYNYPWGNEADPAKANVPESKNPFRAGSRPTSPPPGYKAASGPPGQAWRMGANALTTPVGFFNGKLHRKADFDWPGEAETYQTANGANGYGLYDMAGNVWQWCTEWYERNYYAYGPITNPPGPATGSPMQDGKPYRCMRGGSWFNGEFGHSRVSNRDPSYYRGPDPVTGLSDADGPFFHIGFRLVLPVNAESRPAIKPTPVQRIAGRDGGGGGGGRPSVGGGGPRANNQAASGDERPARAGQGGGGGAGGQSGFRLLPPRAQEQLNLTADQQKQLMDLETEAKAKLDKILTPDQQQLMKQMRSPQRSEGANNSSPAPSQGTPAPRTEVQPPDRADTGVIIRKPSASFMLRSPAMTDGGTMPKEFTGDGEGATPPLEWSGAPAGTKSFALIMHHTNRGQTMSYWILYNIPANLKSLPKAVKGIGTLGVSTRGNHAAYSPPHSGGPGARTYVFTVYALSAPPQLNSKSDVTYETLLAAIKDNILATADLSVSHTRYTVGETSEAAGQNSPRQTAPAQRGMERPTDANLDNQPAPPDNQAGGQRAERQVAQVGQGAPNGEGRRSAPGGQGGAGGGERRGGGGRMAEHNKTPASPNPGQTVGVFINSPKAYNGYTLLAPKHNTNIFLINNAGQILHQWHSQYYPGQSVYLKPNGNLLHPCMTRNRSFTGGGEGGRIEEYDWDGKLLWEFPYATDKYQQHHDIAPLPNGNILMLVVEKKTAAECIAAGWPAETAQGAELYPDGVVEIQPVYPNGGKVVWEWRVWDHMVQNFEKTKPNYGDPSAHPERIAIRGGRGGPNGFWNHANSIAYNAQLDQVCVSARGQSEIWFIDHSTTSQEAAGHSGGKHGQGGDLIYRWGNPGAYGRGSERESQLNQQHDGEWIPEGYPGAGHVTIFNNGYNRGYSSIEEIVPPLDARGRYILEPGKPFGPEKTFWHYEAPNRTDFFSSEISGAHRLPNGNTLICAGVIGHLFEVTPSGERVWQYVNPATRYGTLAQGELPGVDTRGHLFNAVFKAHRYAPDYAAFKGRDLTPKGPIELPASMKGKTGLDQANAVPGERPAEMGGRNGQGGQGGPGVSGQGGGRRPGGPGRQGSGNPPSGDGPPSPRQRNDSPLL